MKCSVIGNGPLGVSVAVQLSEGGCDVTYIDLSNDKGILKSYGAVGEIPVLDDEEYKARVAVCDSFESIKECELLVIGTTSSCYFELFEEIKHLIRNDMHVLFMPACFGAIILKHQLAMMNIRPVISESTSYPYVCAMSEKGLVVQSKKQTLGLSVCPAGKKQEETEFYNKYFRIFKPTDNFLFTSLDNMNFTLHPLPVLLNLVATDCSSTSFRHYIDGFASPVIGKMTEMLDEERIKIGKAYGLNLTPSLIQLKNYYGDSDAGDIRTYVTNPEGPYPKIGCFGPKSRYVDEDIPGLLVPALGLAIAAGLDVPMVKMCINLANLINEKDYCESGFNLARLGLDGKDVSEIINAVEI